MEILIISGLSGGGKSKAASFLEDMGFYIVDNMPAAMILKFAEFCAAVAVMGAVEIDPAAENAGLAVGDALPQGQNRIGHEDDLLMYGGRWFFFLYDRRCVSLRQGLIRQRAGFCLCKNSRELPAARLSKNPYIPTRAAHLAPSVLAVLTRKRCGARFVGSVPQPQSSCSLLP